MIPVLCKFYDSNKITSMAELRLNSEIIGNFRNFEKFLGPLV